MARTLFDCVGDWFETVLQTQIPDLRKVKSENGTRPDFSCEVFDAEAKTGFWDYGAQLKEAQVRNFKSSGKPIVYVIGYHNAAGLKESTAKMSEEEIDTFLKNKAGMHSAYVVSNEIIRRLWKRENHVAANHPDWRYFSVRPRHLDAIIYNNPFKRGTVRYTPSKRYRICLGDLMLQPAPQLTGPKSKLKFGTILNRDTDKPVIDYMSSRGLIEAR